MFHRIGSRHRVRRCWAAIPLLLVMAGCDGLLTVENPGAIRDEDLDTPEGVAALAAGVAGSFNAAYTSAALWSALLSGELLHAGTAPAERNASLGLVDTEPAAYTALSSTRWQADDAARRFRALLDDADRRPETASVLVYAGFSLLLLADNHCQIPLDGGPPHTPEEIYVEAEKRFTDALDVAAAAGDAELEERAYAGRARARLMLGRYAEARADAQRVSDGFVFLSIHSETTQNNAFPARTVSSIRREISVHPRYYEDPRFQNDPRVPFVDNGELGVDGSTAFVEQLKYRTRSDDMEISSWQEARLIEAEVVARIDNPASAVPLIDKVREAAGLPPYDGPVSSEAILAQIAYERAAELFLEGQRLVDMRRFGDPWLQGRGTCFDVSQDERDGNPNMR